MVKLCFNIIDINAILIASPSDPNIWPALSVFLRLFCQTFQQGEFFSKEKVPMLICGAKASFLASLIFILELLHV